MNSAWSRILIPAVLTCAASCVLDDRATAISSDELDLAQMPQPTAALEAPNAGIPERFGVATALEGDLAVVGAPHDKEGGEGAGAAYVFLRASGAWKLVQKLTASEPAERAFFGAAVAIDGDTLLVGAPGRGDIDGFDDEPVLGPPGAVHAFIRTRRGFAARQVLSPPGVAARDGFGSALAASGDYMIIGAPRDPWDSGGAGFAYAFTRDAGMWDAGVLLRGSSEDWDGFGMAVAASDGRVAVGAPRGKFQEPGAGAVHIYEHTAQGWTESAMIGLPGPPLDEDFGAAVALSGDVLLVGAPGRGPRADGGGGAYSYLVRNGEWRFIDRLQPFGARTGDGFGSSVALIKGPKFGPSPSSLAGMRAAGTLAIVGSPRRSGETTGEGAAYVFERDLPDSAWRMCAMLAPPGESAGLGWSVGVSSGAVIAGTRAGGNALVWDPCEPDNAACSSGVGCL